MTVRAARTYARAGEESQTGCHRSVTSICSEAPSHAVAINQLRGLERYEHRPTQERLPSQGTTSGSPSATPASIPSCASARPDLARRWIGGAAMPSKASYVARRGGAGMNVPATVNDLPGARGGANCPWIRQLVFRWAPNSPRSDSGFRRLMSPHLAIDAVVLGVSNVQREVGQAASETPLATDSHVGSCTCQISPDGSSGRPGPTRPRRQARSPRIETRS
jgi:hypothetical protein